MAVVVLRAAWENDICRGVDVRLCAGLQVADMKYKLSDDTSPEHAPLIVSAYLNASRALRYCHYGFEQSASGDGPSPGFNYLQDSRHLSLAVLHVFKLQ